jgi:hypothetical protein
MRPDGAGAIPAPKTISAHPAANVEENHTFSSQDLNSLPLKSPYDP